MFDLSRMLIADYWSIREIRERDCIKCKNVETQRYARGRYALIRGQRNKSEILLLERKFAAAVRVLMYSRNRWKSEHVRRKTAETRFKVARAKGKG